MWRILGGLFMGWSLGSNDAANVFGTGVSSKVISLRLANILLGIFLLLGAVIEGPKCMELIKDVSALDDNPAFVSTITAAVTMTFMSIIGIPASTSQAIMGGIIGAGMASGQKLPELSVFTKIVVCWVGTPIGACIIAFILMRILVRIQDRLFRSASSLNLFIKIGLIVAGSYGSYSLGANNVANTTGVYYACGLISVKTAVLLGAISMIIGAWTFGARVMKAVGSEITDVGPLGALVAILAEALTVHLYTQVGVPVSTSQAIVGAVTGIGLVRGASNVYKGKLIQIFIGWLMTPVSAGIMAFLICLVMKLVQNWL